jgi:hypothetical protein
MSKKWKKEFESLERDWYDLVRDNRETEERFRLLIEVISKDKRALKRVKKGLQEVVNDVS